MEKIIGYACGNRPVEEFMIVQEPFYSEIDFQHDCTVDPRRYCVVKAENGNYYLISVYNFQNIDAINAYEHTEGDVKVIVRDICELGKYEIARNFAGDYITYDLDRNSLLEKLNEIVQSNAMEAAGFKSIKAFSFFEKSEKLKEKADYLEKNTEESGELLRLQACIYKIQAYAIEADYIKEQLESAKPYVKIKKD